MTAYITQVSALVTAPTVEPVSLLEAKNYLRIDVSADDALIAMLIPAARQWVESYTRRALCTQTWDVRVPYFPQARQPLTLPHAPLQSVTSITYIDEDEATQTLSASDYAVRTFTGPYAGRGFVELRDNVSLPSVSALPLRPVTVRAVCGYGNADAVPQGIKAAILLFLGDLYEQRQTTIAGTISSKTQTTVELLLAPYRLSEVPA